MARLHSTPREVLAAAVRETITIDGRAFVLDRPADPTAAFAHPEVQAAKTTDDYLPHWVNLWPASRLLAAEVLREPWPGFGEPPDVLEIGCGLGLAGLAALARGLQVVFMDVDDAALEFAAHNARLNGFTEFDILHHDFRTRPAGWQFPTVIGADLIYQDRLVRPLVEFLREVLAPGGLALFADPNRPDGPRFRHLLASAGFTVESTAVRWHEPGYDLVTGTIDRVREKSRRP